jgi:hypothetical protein
MTALSNGVRSGLFEDEALDVTVCGSLVELQAGIKHHRAEVVALASTPRGTPDRSGQG